jgi:NitT/TauT family transport system substrate-binding protein
MGLSTTRRLAALGILLTLAATACGGGSGEKTSTSGAHQIKVAFLTSGTIATYYAAQRQGFFSKNGLQVKESVLSTAPLIQAALDRGEVDIIFGVASAGLAAREAGRDMVAVLQVETARSKAPDSYPLLVKKGSPIHALADLAGKKIAVANAGSQIVANLKVLLNRAGIDPKKVVLNEAPFASHRDLLASGQVDATLTLEPFRTQIVKEGVGQELLYPYLDADPGQPLGAWWTTRKWAQSHAADLDAFVKAQREAMDWLMANPDQARQTIASFTKIDPNLLADMLLPNWVAAVDKNAWQKLLEILVEAGSLKSAGGVDDLLYKTALGTQ